jgi:hypothetical protein
LPTRRQGVISGVGTVMRQALRRHLPEGLQALVVRDVLLTLRFFSFGVILHFIGALLCLAVMLNLLRDVQEDARAVQVVTGLARRLAWLARPPPPPAEVSTSLLVDGALDLNANRVHLACQDLACQRDLVHISTGCCWCSALDASSVPARRAWCS